MENSYVQLNDLPDEILMIILKNMNNVAILFSLMDVNKRLNKIVHDPTFTSHLTFLKCLSDSSIHPYCESIIDRFCLQILPSIHHKIICLNLEASSMKRILLATDYPNLRGLGLYNIDDETVKYVFSDETLSSGIFKTQISTLVININKNKAIISKNIMENILNGIFTVFTNLRDLQFNELSHKKVVLLRLDFPPMFFSSTLLKLSIKAFRFDECLYLLDGRFDQLRTFYVDTIAILPVWSEINQQVELRNLKCFSVSCDNETCCYDTLIVPLLHRMLNLEELGLYLYINHRGKGFIDGNNMKKNIINHMPRLNNFVFNIRSTLSLNNQIYLPSNQDIQQTFRNFQANQIISSVDYFSDKSQGQCHVYSCPYTMRHYNGITNNFPGGLFEYVYEVSLFDERPFEHEFFLRISQSFPFMTRLSITNNKPQNVKLCCRLDDNGQNLSVIKYLHLSELILYNVHDDYIEQFLVDTKTYLRNNIYLWVEYESLQRVTHNFTRNTTRINCTKLGYIGFYGKPEFLPNLSHYFPHAEKIC